MNENNINILCTTQFGLEDYCAAELNKLGVKEPKITNRAVSFNGTLKDLYQCNLWLRTATRVLLPFPGFRVSSDTDLYNNARKIPWEKYFSVDQTFLIEPVINSKLFRHTGYAALKTKDAIVDRFRDITGKRPSIDKADPDIYINLNISGNDVVISLDSSGEPLNKRGYRKKTGFAPLNETLAAGLLLASGWNMKKSVIDPMCGSGTIIAEAALLASNTAPGLIRNEFAFMNWNNFDAGLWGTLFELAENKRRAPNVNLFGYDISSNMISIARDNLSNQFFEDVNITLETSDFFKSAPAAENGLIICNPPYGERIKLTDTASFYRDIGDKLKADYDGYDVWLLSTGRSALKNVGLRTSRKLTFNNGSIEVKLHKYEMYRGSKKHKEDGAEE